MKKLTVLLMALALCLSLLAACGGDETADPQNSPSAAPSETISQETEESDPVEEPAGESEVPSEEPSEEPSQEPSDDAASFIEDQFALSSSDFTLFAAGDSWQLTYTANPVYDESPVFTSSDESVATVDENGVVTAVAPGKAVITATYGTSGEASCIVRCRWEEAGESQPPVESEAPSGSADAVDLAAFYTSLCEQYGENFPANADIVEFGMLNDMFPGLGDIAAKQLLAYQPMMGAVVCEIVLVEVENSSDVETVKEILQTRIDTQVDGGAWYPESIEGWQNNSRIVSNGNYVMMIAYSECDAVVDAFNALF